MIGVTYVLAVLNVLFLAAIIIVLSPIPRNTRVLLSLLVIGVMVTAYLGGFYISQHKGVQYEELEKLDRLHQE